MCSRLLKYVGIKEIINLRFLLFRNSLLVKITAIHQMIKHMLWYQTTSTKNNKGGINISIKKREVWCERREGEGKVKYVREERERKRGKTC